MFFNNNNNNNNNGRIITWVIIHIDTPMGAIHIAILKVVWIAWVIDIVNNVVQSNKVML